jgi:hypothetical protein
VPSDWPGRAGIASDRKGGFTVKVAARPSTVATHFIDTYILDGFIRPDYPASAFTSPLPKSITSLTQQILFFFCFLVGTMEVNAL